MSAWQYTVVPFYLVEEALRNKWGRFSQEIEYTSKLSSTHGSTCEADDITLSNRVRRQRQQVKKELIVGSAEDHRDHLLVLSSKA